MPVDLVLSPDITVYEADWVCPITSPPLRDAAIAVQNGRIIEVGPQAAVQGTTRRRFASSVLIPGFVNAHTHLELAIFEGLLGGLPFADWIARLVRIKYGSLDEQALKVSARLGAKQMLRAGVTAVGEVMDTGAGWDAMLEYGLQGVAYQEVFGPDEATLHSAMSGLKTKVETHRRRETATQRIGVSPHAPYTVSRSLYEAVRDFARREKLLMSAHVAESGEETRFVRDGAGRFAEAHQQRGIAVSARECTPVRYFDALGLLGPDMLLVHVIETDAEEWRRIREAGTFVVHCPKSNQTLAHDVAPVAEMLNLGIPIALGTDSIASNDAIDMFAEMRLAGEQQHLAPEMLFRMATIEGARALGLDKEIGSLDPGKRADFVVVSTAEASESPLEGLVDQASVHNVLAVFVGGREVSLDDTSEVQAVRKIRDAIPGLSRPQESLSTAKAKIRLDESKA